MKLTKIFATTIVIASTLLMTGCFDSKDKASFKDTEYVCTTSKTTFYVSPYKSEVKGIHYLENMNKSPYRAYATYTDMSENPKCDISDICTVRKFEMKSVNTKTKQDGPYISIYEKAHKNDPIKIEYQIDDDYGYCTVK